VTVVQMPPEHRDAALDELRRSPHILMAEKDAVLEQLDTAPNDTDWSAQWGLRRVGYPSAWDRTRGLSSVTVAVLDTGVNSDVPDLRDAASSGYNAIAPADAARDDNGHGTSVAGIVAARTNNSEGIAGICWSCSILAVKVLGADGTGDTALVAAGIVHAADAGTRVISMSLGGPADDQTLDHAAAYALAKGAVLVAAAGNNGSSTPFYPAAIPGVISVAATDQSDRLYPWSNFGSWVQVAAPGCNPAPSSAGGYVMFCGTSSATPVVSGLVALLLSERPNASRDEVVAAIDATAVPIGDGVVRGRIDATAQSTLASALAAPDSGQASPAGSATIATLSGALSGRHAVRVYRQAITPTQLTAVLKFSGQRVLTLSIRDATGTLVARTRGMSPLRLTRDLSGGTFAFGISGRKATALFQLALSGRPSSQQPAAATPAGGHVSQAKEEARHAH
jgi:subtilisin family serine protease